MLLELLSDADAGVRAEAARALGSAARRGSGAALMEAFHDYDVAGAGGGGTRPRADRRCPPVSRPWCAGSRTPAPNSAAPSPGRWGRSAGTIPSGSSTCSSRATIAAAAWAPLAALAKMGHATGRELIRSMLHDADHEVVLRGGRRGWASCRTGSRCPELHALAREPGGVDAPGRDRSAVPHRRPGEPRGAAPGGLRPRLAGAGAGGAGARIPARRRVGRSPASDVVGVGALDAADARPRAPGPHGLRARGGPAAGAGRAAAGAALRLPARARAARRSDPARHRRARARPEVVEYMVASIQSRAELETALVAELASAQSRRAAGAHRAHARPASRARRVYPAVWRTFYKDPIRGGAGRGAAVSWGPDRAGRGVLPAAHGRPARPAAARARRGAAATARRCRCRTALPLVVAHLGSPDEELQTVLLDYLAGLPDAVLERFLDGVLGTRSRDAGAPAVGAGARAAYRIGCRHAPARRSSRNRNRRCGARRWNRWRKCRARRRWRSSEAACRTRMSRCASGPWTPPPGSARRAGVPLLPTALEDPVADVRRTGDPASVAPRAARRARRDACRNPRRRAAGARRGAGGARVVEGSQPVEEWMGPHDVPALAEALARTGPAAELERRLATVAAGRSASGR